MTRLDKARPGKLIAAVMFGYLMIVSSLALLAPSVEAATLQPGPDATQQWPLDQFPEIADDMLQDQNMSNPLSLQGGYVMGWNEATGDVYAAGMYGGGSILWVYHDSTGLWENLGAVNGTSSIRGLTVTMDGFLIVTVNTAFVGDRHIFRSIDGGYTWTNPFNITRGADCWNIEHYGDNWWNPSPYVYIAEYGKSTEQWYNTIWYSDAQGAPGSWAEVPGGRTFNRTAFDEPGVQNHWHDGYYDNETGDMYFVGGDSQDKIIRSEDGINFAAWGGFTDGACAMSGDNNNLYIWEDGAPWALHTYNRTTQEFRYEAKVTNTSGAFYTGIGGHYGVQYGYSVTEGGVGRSSHIFGSVDGKRLFVISNQTTLYQAGFRVMGPVYSQREKTWSIWYDETTATARTSPGWVCFPHRFRDLTREEGLALEYQARNATISSTVTVKENGYSYNGERRLVDFAQDYARDTTIKVTGHNVTNLARNGDGFENIPELNRTDYPPAAAGWTYWSSLTPNITATVTAARSHSGTYSMKIVSSNVTAGTWAGSMRYIRVINLGTSWTFTASLYLSIERSNYDPQDGGFYVTCSQKVLYADTSADTWDMNGGAGSNFYTIEGNMTGNQWERCWTTGTTDDEKSVIWLITDLDVSGRGTVYVDDYQVQNGSMMTPYIPFSTGAYLPSQSISLNMNGQSHNFGTLNDGQTASWNMGTIAGLPRMIWSIGGSKIVNWTISGTRLADSTNCLISNQSGFLRAWAVYDNSKLRVWSSASAAILPGSWINPTTYKPGGLQITPMLGPVSISNITTWDLLTSDGEVANWTQNGTMTRVTYYMTGLNDGSGYTVFADGDEVAHQSTGHTTMLFEVSGNVTVTIEMLTPAESSNVDQFKGLVSWAIALVIVLIVINFAIMAYQDGFDYGDFIEVVAILSIGISVYVVVARYL